MDKKIRIDRNLDNKSIRYYLSKIDETTSQLITKELKKPVKDREEEMFGIDLSTIHMIGDTTQIKSRDLGQIIKINKEEKDSGTWYIVCYRKKSTGEEWRTYDEVPISERESVTPMMSQTWKSPTGIFIDFLREVGNPRYALITKETVWK